MNDSIILYDLEEINWWDCPFSLIKVTAILFININSSFTMITLNPYRDVDLHLNTSSLYDIILSLKKCA